MDIHDNNQQNRDRAAFLISSLDVRTNVLPAVPWQEMDVMRTHLGFAVTFFNMKRNRKKFISVDKVYMM